MNKGWPSPENLLRYSALASLIGAVATMIFGGGNSSHRDLSLFFFTCMWVFLLFYAQYFAVLKITKRSLDPRFGYAQVVVCLLFVLYGGVKLFHPSPEAAVALAASDFFDHTLIALCWVGEAMFVLNVVWSHASQRAPVAAAAKPSPLTPLTRGVGARTQERRTWPWLWPKSPVGLFGYTAAFLALGGAIALIARLGGRYLIPISNGPRWVAAGWIWLILAAPFALFAALYVLFGRVCSTEFHPSAKRIHFLLTFVAVADAVRLWFSWQVSFAIKYPPFDARRAMYEGSAFFAAAIVAFAANVLLSVRRASART